jgi:hypothetical protein
MEPGRWTNTERAQQRLWLQVGLYAPPNGDSTSLCTPRILLSKWAVWFQLAKVRLAGVGPVSLNEPRLAAQYLRGPITLESRSLGPSASHASTRRSLLRL